MTRLKPTFEDVDSIFSACSELGLPPPERVKNYPIYYDNTDMLANGWSVRIPGWHKAIVFQKNGRLTRVCYDCWEGRLSSKPELTRLLKACVVAAVKKAVSEKPGVTCETVSEDLKVMTTEGTFTLKFLADESGQLLVDIESVEAVPDWLSSTIGNQEALLEV